MSEYRINVTVSQHGHDPDNGVAFLDGFMETHPEVGPSVSQNTADGTLSVTFALDAEEPNEAFEQAWPVFRDGANASGLEATEILSVNVSRVPVEEFETADAPEPVSA